MPGSQSPGLLGSSAQLAAINAASPQHQVGSARRSEGATNPSGARPQGGQNPLPASGGVSAGRSARNSATAGASDSTADNNASATVPAVTDPLKLIGRDLCPCDGCDSQKSPLLLAMTWSQSEGNVTKDNLGVSIIGDLSANPLDYELRQTITLPVGNMAHGMNEGLYPHGLVHYDGFRIFTKQIYTENIITGFEVHFHDMATESDWPFTDAADLTIPPVPLTFLTFTETQNFGTGTGQNRMKAPTSIIYLNEQKKGYVHILGQCNSATTGPNAFKLLSLDLTNLRSESKVAQHTSTLTGYLNGGSNISITDKTLFQDNPFKGPHVWSTLDYLNWTVAAANQNLTAFMSPLPGGVTATFSSGTSIPTLFNPSPARLCTQDSADPPIYFYSNFIFARTFQDQVFPSGGVPGNTTGTGTTSFWGMRLTNMKSNANGNPETPQDVLVVPPLTVLDPRRVILQSVIDAYDQAIKDSSAIDETVYYTPNTFSPGNYPVSGWSQHEDTTEFINCDGNYSAAHNIYYACTDICTSFCGGGPYDSCSPYHLHYGIVVVNSSTSSQKYKGPHMGQQFGKAQFRTYIPMPPESQPVATYPAGQSSADYPWPASPIEANFNSAIKMLPAASANTVQSPRSILRSQWSSASGSPEVVISSSGKVVQAALCPVPVQHPGAQVILPTGIRTRWDQLNYGVPVSWSFPQFTTWSWHDVPTGCEDCHAAGNSIRGEDYLIGNAGSGELLLENGATGQEIVEYEFWWPTAIQAMYETVMILSDALTTAAPIVVVLSETFSGFEYPGWKAHSSDPEPVTIPIPTQLPVPENVWQIIPIGNLVVVLMDFRYAMKNSPIPCLKCYSTSGAKLGEYRDLISSDIKTDTYTSDVTVTGADGYKIYDGDAKWYFHGKHSSGGKAIGTFTGDTPGPRMKATWTGVAGGDAIIHVSCECYEKKPYPPYAFQSRVEYRILKLSPSGTFTELFSGHDEITNNCLLTDLGAWAVVQFSSAYPRPKTLMNMAVADDFFEFVHQTRDDPTKWEIRRKSVNP